MRMISFSNRLVFSYIARNFDSYMVPVKMVLNNLAHYIENLSKYCDATECTFDVNTTYTRTPTFDWFNEHNEHGNYELKIIDSKLGFRF